MTKIKDAQRKYRPDRIKVLFVAESPPASGSYFYYGGNRLLHEMRRALKEDQRTDADFLMSFMKRGWYLDDLVQTPVKNQSELKNKCRKARDDLAARIRRYSPCIVVCLVRRIRDDVEIATLKAGSDACVYTVSFPPRHSQRFQAEMSLLRPRLERLP
jgi:hypothetical protein